MKKKEMVLVLLDLDGVLFDDSERIHLALQGKWEEYYDGLENDTVWPEGRELYEKYINDPNHKIGYLTARKEDRREPTISKLMRERFSVSAPLYMRPMDNTKSLAEFKAAVVASMQFVYKDVVLYDDDPAIVEYIKKTIGTNNAVLCTWNEKPKEMINNG